MFLVFSPLFPFFQKAYAGIKKIILPKNTPRDQLTGKHPRNLDTRNLEITPLDDFETMGPTDHEVDPVTWRLEINGEVKKPLKVSLSQILQMPSISRNVLLICPGIFANHGKWKGVSIGKLLEAADVKADADRVTITGPVGPYEKTAQFPIADIRSDKVFLAYQVNDQTLPQEHGFPVRVVAEDYYGDDWIKYVDRITAYKI